MARKLGVHRRMVRETILDTGPVAHKKPDRPHWKLKEFIPLIERDFASDFLGIMFPSLPTDRVHPDGFGLDDDESLLP